MDEINESDLWDIDYQGRNHLFIAYDEENENKICFDLQFEGERLEFDMHYLSAVRLYCKLGKMLKVMKTPKD